MIFNKPAIAYICGNNNNDPGFISIKMVDSKTGITNKLYLTCGGIKENNTHFICKGWSVEKIENLSDYKYYYIE